jgi:hypothetical protein
MSTAYADMPAYLTNPDLWQSVLSATFLALSSKMLSKSFSFFDSAEVIIVFANIDMGADADPEQNNR